MARSAGVKVARGILFVFSRLIVVAVVVALIILGYYTAMATMNVNVIVKDAFTKRAEIILEPGDDKKANTAALEKVFTQRAMAADEALLNNSYDEFEITGYFNRVDIESVFVWPWMDTVTLEVTDIVKDITGKEIKTVENTPPVQDFENDAGEEAGTEEETGETGAEGETAGEGEDSAAAQDIDEEEEEEPEREPPLWKNSIYEVEVIKRGDSWKVNKMVLKERIAVENTPKETPTPSATRSAIATPDSTKPPEQANTADPNEELDVTIE